MAKRKKRSSKVQKKKLATVRPAKKAATKATKRVFAKVEPKRAQVKKAARKEPIKQPVAPAVEAVTVEHPAPEFEEANHVSPGPDEQKE
jgi:hypothetical protein